MQSGTVNASLTRTTDTKNDVAKMARLDSIFGKKHKIQNKRRIELAKWSDTVNDRVKIKFWIDRYECFYMPTVARKIIAKDKTIKDIERTTLCFEAVNENLSKHAGN